MILEGIVTTIGDSGEVNVAPMGPLVEPGMKRLILRPFTSSTTYRNLKRTGQGVFHVTDDVGMLARAAVGKLDPQPPMIDAPDIEGRILTGACRWYALRVATLDDTQERTRIEADVVAQGTLREFFGFNRAKHAVLEAAILCTRLHLIPAAEVAEEMKRLASPVEKTAGPEEREAFAFLEAYIRGYDGSRP
jgi:hypothetical protein